MVVVTLNVRYRESELDYMLNQSGAKAVVSSARLGDFDYVALYAGIADRLPTVEHYFFLGLDSAAGDVSGVLHRWPGLENHASRIGVIHVSHQLSAGLVPAAAKVLRGMARQHEERQIRLESQHGVRDLAHEVVVHGNGHVELGMRFDMAQRHALLLGKREERTYLTR